MNYEMGRTHDASVEHSELIIQNSSFIIQNLF